MSDPKPFVVRDPRMMSETQIEDKVCEWAKLNGYLTPKVKFAEKGWPDRMFISPYGATIFIEFKRLGGVPDDIQEYRLKELHKRGVPVACCDSVFTAIRLLQDALTPPSPPELAAARIPKASDQAATVTRECGIIFGPRAGENQRRLSGPEDPEGPRYDAEGPGDCAADGGDRRMAGGTEQVGGIQGPVVLGPPREAEGKEPPT